MGGRYVEGHFVEGRLVEGRLVGRTFCSEGRFVEGRFVLVPNFPSGSVLDMEKNGGRWLVVNNLKWIEN
jgi:hypothetical protein